MDKQKQIAIERLEHSIENAKVQIDFVKSLPDDLPGDLNAWEWAVSLTIPYDVETLRKVRAMLGSDFAILEKPRVDQDGDLVVSYRRKDDKTYRHQVNVFANATLKGSTCRRVQKGTKEVPVYEIVCDDKAGA